MAEETKETKKIIPESKKKMCIRDRYYSSSELGQVTSVKDQGNTELCWAFGITSMGETSLIKQGIASTNVDFSEKHFGYFMYLSLIHIFTRLVFI